MRINPTLTKPTELGRAFDKSSRNITASVSPNVKLNEIDGILSEVEQSLKKKIFNLGKMESLVFSDPKLSTVYDEMSVNGEEKYGYHYNETIMNMIFNDYVLNSPKYLQKYKMSIPKEKKRRDKSGINKLKKDGDEKMAKSGLDTTKNVDETTGAAGSSGAFAPALGFEKRVQETTTAASSGAYSGPAAWGGGDLMKGSKSNVMRKPIWQGGAIIQESNYLTDSSGFEKYVKVLNEQTENDYIIDNTSAFNSDSVKGWNDNDKKVELDTLRTGVMDNPNINTQSLSRESKINTIKNKMSSSNKFNIPDDYLNKVNDDVIDRLYYKLTTNKNSNENNVYEDATTMANASKSQSKEDSMSNKMETSIQVGTQSTGGLQESLDLELFEKLNEELNAYLIHHNSLVKMNEDKKISSEVARERIISQNPSNFKKDLQHSGTKEIINVEKELQWKDQQSEVSSNPQKLSQDIEKNTNVDSLKNVGDSANDSGDEIPKRNLTTEEQDEVDMYRLGQQDLIYDNKPNEKFEDRMKADMGDVLYKQRQKKMEFRANAPMYNKDTQPIENGIKKTQFSKEESGWGKRDGIKESMITGRFSDALNKRRIIDFKLNEVKIVTTVDDLFELDFTGLGNTYNSKTVDNKVIVNEEVVNALSTYKFYTDGKNIMAIKSAKKSLNESVDNVIVINEEFDKMKHLLGYRPNNFIDTNNIKKNRGF